MKTPGPHSSCGHSRRKRVTLSLESTLQNFSTASFTFFLLCLVFFGLVYVFFLRFLPPPCSSKDKKTVESSPRPHSPSFSASPSERPPNATRCSATGTPCAWQI